MFKATLMLWLASAAMAEDLLPLQFIREVHTAVYELPELAGRTEMLGAIDASLKRAFPLAEVINASGMPDAALREKMQGPFLLVTSLDERARLLPLAAKALPLRFDKTTLTWRDLTVPVKDALISFVGKHPFGSGYCLVIAAGDLALLNGRTTWGAPATC